MCSPDIPEPPDPNVVAAAQTGTNVSTAVANNTMGLIDQDTPYGNLRNEVIGYETITDGATGTEYQVPRYRQTTTLNDMQQATLDETQGAQFNLGALANERAGFLRDYLPDTEGLTDSIAGRLSDMGRQRLDPRFEREEDALRTRMANQGISSSSEAWRREMGQFREGKNDAYNQLNLDGRGQAMAEVNAPINQITALLSGSQVSSPDVSRGTSDKAATTDYAGLVNQNYEQRVRRAQAMDQNIMGGLFDLGSAAIMSSDRRLKKSITRIGDMNGLNVYSFRYKDEADDAELRVGFMADEVEQIAPDAVITADDGFKRVDYAKALEAV